MQVLNASIHLVISPFSICSLFTLTFISNVGTIPQKKNEFLTKASLLIAGWQHFGYLMDLPIEFLFFYYIFLADLTFSHLHSKYSSALECQSFWQTNNFTSSQGLEKFLCFSHCCFVYYFLQESSSFSYLTYFSGD